MFTVPQPSRQNKLTNTMFLEQFSGLLESYASCDRLFVVGDLNVHFDKPPTSALNVVLDNLSLHQLVNVPTHRRGHTLDWLIKNRATDVLAKVSLSLSLICRATDTVTAVSTWPLMDLRDKWLVCRLAQNPCSVTRIKYVNPTRTTMEALGKSRWWPA